MLSPAEIRKKALRRYPDYLKALVRGETADFFPLDIPGNKGRSRTPFAELYPALKALLSRAKEATGSGYSVELETVNTRHAGEMTLPKRVYFASEGDFLSFLEKKREVLAFRQALAKAEERAPELLPWLAAYPQKLVDALPIWEDVLKVLTYFRTHPRPGYYLRELPIEVHTKFIESHQRLVAEVLEAALPPAHYESAEAHFARRFGLRYDEPLIRLRSLAGGVLPELPSYVTDLSLPLSQAQQLSVAATRAFIVENKQTFLAFPAQAASLVIWGKGFAVELLAALPWLEGLELWFWGDLDAQGFEMLHQLRRAFPQTRSLLMDRATYDAFAAFAVATPPPVAKQLPTLQPGEQALYQHLLATPQANRLEQEHISQAALWRQLEQLPPLD